MRTAILLSMALLSLSCAQPEPQAPPKPAFKPETILNLERAALDRWGHGDPSGYLELYAPEITYFDPTTEASIKGLAAMQKYYAPLAGKIQVERYAMRNISIQQHGDVVALSYNLINLGASFDGKPENPPRPWNSTKIYAQINGQWKIIHVHWSYIKPQLK